MGGRLDQTLAVLNGLLGDYLSRTGNGLATEMSFRHDGRMVAVEGESLARVYPNASSRVVVLVHGVMCTESVWTLGQGGDYGSLLGRDLGFTPLDLRYNSGRSIAENGSELAGMLERFVDQYPAPVDELLLLGYSMGGLVMRSACHFAGLQHHNWLERVDRAIYVGTPHLGAPAERAGRVVTKILSAIDDPYTRLIADIGNLRSAGVKDLGDGVLVHSDSSGRVADAFRSQRHPLPLLAGIRHYLIAGCISADPRLSALLGDSIVPVSSATSGALADAASELLPEQRVRVLPGLSHLALPRHPEVYAQILAFCEEEST